MVYKDTQPPLGTHKVKPIIQPGVSDSLCTQNGVYLVSLDLYNSHYSYMALVYGLLL